MSAIKTFVAIGLMTKCACIFAGEEQVELTIESPVYMQVYQRQENNQAEISITGKARGIIDAIEARAELPENAGMGKEQEWHAMPGFNRDNNCNFSGTMTLQAGGWYKIDVRAIKNGIVVEQTAVDKVGIGEVFVTAGQSNSANFGRPRQKAANNRVVYFDGESYIPAADPIPGGCGRGGSPWPILGDLITEYAGVPVCFRSASLTWTRVKNWLPTDTTLYKNLVNCVNYFGHGGIRAILWHQGESDSLAGTQASEYCKMMKTIIEALNRDCGYRVPWFVAQASFHPGASRKNQEEVAAGQGALWANGTAFPGPVTDDLKGEEYRHDGVHFNQAGLDSHARRWFDVLQAQYRWNIENVREITLPILPQAQ